MKNLFLLLILVSLLFACSSAPPGPVGADSPEHLLELTKKYFSKRDINNMMLLYKTEGISPELIATRKRTLEKTFMRKAESFKLTNLDDKAKRFFNKRRTIKGQNVYFNVNIIGQITIDLDESRQESLLYGQNIGRYFFALQIIE